MPTESVSSLEETPLLSRLGLSVEEIAALRRQGFVSREQRRGRTLFKLRFRMPPDGRQHVRYLGVNPAVAEAVRRELAQMQRVRRLDLELGKLRRKIAEELRDRWKSAAPQFKRMGYQFHGRTIRQVRVAE
jgi:hypothetical protein